MAQVIYDGLWVCVDCAELIANGEINDGTDTAERVSAAQVALWGDDTVNLVLAFDEDCEGDFSWSPCDGCGSTLGGDRLPAAVVRQET